MIAEVCFIKVRMIVLLPSACEIEPDKRRRLERRVASIGRRADRASLGSRSRSVPHHSVPHHSASPENGGPEDSTSSIAGSASSCRRLWLPCTLACGKSGQNQSAALFNVSKSEYKTALQPEAVLIVVVAAESQRAVIVEAGVEILSLEKAPGNP